AQRAVGGTIGRIADCLKAVSANEARADQQMDRGFLGCRMRAHHTCQCVAVGNSDGGKLQSCRMADNLMRMRGAAQERKIGGGDQFGEGSHANIPCTYHRGMPPWPYRPSR